MPNIDYSRLLRELKKNFRNQRNEKLKTLQIIEDRIKNFELSITQLYYRSEKRNEKFSQTDLEIINELFRRRKIERSPESAIVEKLVFDREVDPYWLNLFREKIFLSLFKEDNFFEFCLDLFDSFRKKKEFLHFLVEEIEKASIFVFLDELFVKLKKALEKRNSASEDEIDFLKENFVFQVLKVENEFSIMFRVDSNYFFDYEDFRFHLRFHLFEDKQKTKFRLRLINESFQKLKAETSEIYDSLDLSKKKFFRILEQELDSVEPLRLKEILLLKKDFKSSIRNFENVLFQANEKTLKKLFGFNLSKELTTLTDRHLIHLLLIKNFSKAFKNLVKKRNLTLLDRELILLTLNEKINELLDYEKDQRRKIIRKSFKSIEKEVFSFLRKSFQSNSRTILEKSLSVFLKLFVKNYDLFDLETKKKILSFLKEEEIPLLKINSLKLREEFFIENKPEFVSELLKDLRNFELSKNLALIHLIMSSFSKTSKKDLERFIKNANNDLERKRILYQELDQILEDLDLKSLEEKKFLFEAEKTNLSLKEFFFFLEEKNFNSFSLLDQIENSLSLIESEKSKKILSILRGLNEIFLDFESIFFQDVESLKWTFLDQNASTKDVLILLSSIFSAKEVPRLMKTYSLQKNLLLKKIDFSDLISLLEEHSIIFDLLFVKEISEASEKEFETYRSRAISFLKPNSNPSSNRKRLL